MGHLKKGDWRHAPPAAITAVTVSALRALVVAMARGGVQPGAAHQQQCYGGGDGYAVVGGNDGPRRGLPPHAWCSQNRATIDAYYSGKLVFGGTNGADAAAARVALGLASSTLVRAAGTTEPGSVAGLRAVMVYTDGACSPNPGPGGWGAVILGLNHPDAVGLSGAEPDSTNNRMELMAVAAGLRRLPERCFVRLATDSAYVVNSLFSGAAERWERSAWQNNGKPVANANLWAALLGQLRRHVVEVEKVQGHAGDPLNERCDRLAVAAREAIARR